MADLEQAVYDRLRNDAAVGALVGTGPVRIFPGVLPKGSTYPAITYFRVGATRVSALGSDTGLVGAHFQISLWSGSMATLIDLANKVRTCLKRMPPGTYSGVVIDGVFLTSEGPDLPEPDAQLIHRPTDYEFWYTEA